MGYITPGRVFKAYKIPFMPKKAKLGKKKTTPAEAPKPRKSRAKKVSKDPKLFVELYKTTVPVDENLSLLEKLPLEILHEVFIYSGVGSLPFVNKRLHSCLKPSLSLVVRMLEMNYLYDLNSAVIKKQKQLANGAAVEDTRAIKEDIRYVLDKDAFKYKCVTINVLKEIKFDTVLPLVSIRAETKNRLILYMDELNKKLLNRMNNDEETTADEVNQELARMAEERFATNNNDNNDNDNDQSVIGMESELNALSEDSQDFHDRFYNFDNFNVEFFELVNYLYTNKRIRYMDSDRMIKSLIMKNVDISTLKKFLSFTKTGKIMSAEPLILAFDFKPKNVLAIGDWIVDNFNDEQLINDPRIWGFAVHFRDYEFLKFLIKKGGSPTNESINIINSMR